MIGLGVVGAGRMAEALARDLVHTDGIDLRAVASRRPAHATAFGARHGAESTYTDVEHLAADPDVDLVYVASPNHLHESHVMTAIRHGKAVLCEKPFGVDASSARRMAEAAAARGVFCMEAMWIRFLPAVQAALAAVERGAIGAPRYAHVEFASPVRHEPGDALFAAPGGGALLDRGVYGVSLLRTLLGAPDDVQASIDATPGGVDAAAHLHLRWPETTASVSVGLGYHGKNSARLSGTAGWVELEPFPRATAFRVGSTVGAAPRSEGPGLALRERPSPLRPSVLGLRTRMASLRERSRVRTRRFGYQGSGYQYQLDEVVRAMAAGELESAIHPLAASVGALEILDRAREVAVGSGAWTR